MPEVALGLALLALAAGLLVGGAELFVENLAAAASRLGLSVLAVAVLLAGAEPEEALTSALASAAGRPALAVGDAIGANITVLALVLGLAAVLAPVPVSPRVRRYAVMSSVAGVCAVAVLADGRASRVEGLALISAYLVLIAVVWWREREPPAIGELAEAHVAVMPGGGGTGPASSADLGAAPGDAAGRTGVAAGAGLAKAFAGIVVMTIGGGAAVAGAQRVVSGTGTSDSVVGLTLLALATSAEMLALVVAAHRHAVAEIAVAGAVGAAAYNATVTLGVAPLVRPLQVHGFLAPSVLAALLPLLLLALARHGRLGRGAGIVLLVVYVAALVATYTGLWAL